jgi:hypothetical protein
MGPLVEFVPVDKPCPQCLQEFAGIPDQPDERCDSCSYENATAWIRKMNECQHRKTKRGICVDCKSGRHGPAQWRWRLLNRIYDVRLHIGWG